MIQWPCKYSLPKPTLTWNIIELTNKTYLTIPKWILKAISAAIRPSRGNESAFFRYLEQAFSPGGNFSRIVLKAKQIKRVEASTELLRAPIKLIIPTFLRWTFCSTCKSSSPATGSTWPPTSAWCHRSFRRRSGLEPPAVGRKLRLPVGETVI